MKLIQKPKENEYPAYSHIYVDLLEDDGFILQHLRQNFIKIKKFIYRLPEELLYYRYDKGKWTIKEILVHIIDDERIFSYRALRYARNDNTPLHGFEQDDYALYSKANERSLDSIFTEYEDKGKESIVKYKRESLDLLSFRGFSEVIGETQHRANTTFLHQPYRAKWEEDFFFPLSGQETKARCFRVDRMRYVDEIPVMIEYTFVPNLDIPGFETSAFINDSLFDTLQLNYHIDVISVQQELRAIHSPDEIAQLLKASPNSPVLHIYRRYSTNREGFYLYSVLYCNTEKYAIGSIFN